MAAAKKSTAKKAAKKSTKKAPAKKSTAKKATKKSTKKAPAKKATKKATASSADVQLVVASRIKEAARDADIRVAGDFAEAFNTEANQVLARAIDRAKSNGRATLRPGDL